MVDLPVDPASVVDIALDELEGVYGYLYRRVGNRADAEDLTQQVALKAMPRLNQGSVRSAIRAYLFATARTELAGFWANRFGLPVEQLHEEIVAVDIERENDPGRPDPVGKADRTHPGTASEQLRAIARPALFARLFDQGGRGGARHDYWRRTRDAASRASSRG